MAYQPPEYLSPSSINTFIQCPLKFKFSRIDGLREPPTEATLLGNFVHDILESLYKKPASERTLNTARLLARAVWDADYAEPVTNLIGPHKVNDFRWRAWFCVENLWQLENPEDVEFAGIEREVKAAIDGVNIRGFIDRFTKDDDGQIVISDYKTGKVPGPGYENDKFLQLFIYAALLQEEKVGTVEAVELVFLKGPKRLARPVTQEIIDETRTTLRQIKLQIDERCDAEHFEYKKTHLCNWCFFKSSCPAWKK